MESKREIDTMIFHHVKNFFDQARTQLFKFFLQQNQSKSEGDRNTMIFPSCVKNYFFLSNLCVVLVNCVEGVS